MQNELNENKNLSDRNLTNSVGRHNARRYALQAMYQWQLSDTALCDLEAEFLRYHIVKKLDINYFQELIHGIPKCLTELDHAMQPFLGRPHSEIDPIELAVLRVGTYELLKRPDVPYRVVINEALVLTKKFGSIDGHKFVNSILDRIAKKTRLSEQKK